MSGAESGYQNGATPLAEVVSDFLAAAGAPDARSLSTDDMERLSQVILLERYAEHGVPTSGRTRQIISIVDPTSGNEVYSSIEITSHNPFEI